jgi:class 3 adenylate cyclase
MDLCDSTATGLRLSTRKLDRFNLALIDQLDPHLEAMQLQHAVVKFTGDGWLVMSDEQEDAARLCCLALVMAAKFQREMSREAGIPPGHVPAMRLAICWGRDLKVTLRGGLRDFVGNSVRRAVRASQLCHDNEVLIDETVRTWVAHDFSASRVDVDDRLEEFPAAKMEEDLALYSLEELRPESADEVDAPTYFVRALNLLGFAREADALVNRISDQLLTEAPFSPDPARLLSRWNELLTTDVDYDTVRELLSDMRAAGLKPDVRTYNALLEKAKDVRSENRWLQAMALDGFRPDTTTLNILLRKATTSAAAERRFSKLQAEGVVPDPESLRILVERAESTEEAAQWARRIESLGVQPDQPTMEAMVARAATFGEAKAWIERMVAAGHEPSEVAFIALFGKDVTEVGADELLAWYLKLPYHPTHPMKKAMAEYRRRGRLDDALRLALDYPHTDTARKLFAKHPERSRAYIEQVLAASPQHANGAYAMGMLLVEQKKLDEAVPYLEMAYSLAAQGTRKDELGRYLALLQGVRSLEPASAV